MSQAFVKEKDEMSLAGCFSFNYRTDHLSDSGKITGSGFMKKKVKDPQITGKYM